ncbi:MAG: transposase [Candidatus Kuenenia sp.]|nr:transposase [Candidatus Kuenenia sp.]
MTRSLRNEYEGAFYHVLWRGNERKEIFRDGKDRSSFTGIQGEMSSRVSVDVFAYVLMGNHYHLLLITLSVISLHFLAKYLMVPYAVGNRQSTVGSRQLAIGSRQIAD